MRLTWRDDLTAAVMAVIIAVYLTFLLGADLPILGTARGTTSTVLVLGAIICVYGGIAAEAKTPPRWFLSLLSGMFAVVAVTAAIIGLTTASTAAVAVLFGATVALWLTLTMSRALPGKRTWSRLGPRTHEVIDQEKVAHG